MNVFSFSMLKSSIIRLLIVVLSLNLMACNDAKSPDVESNGSTPSIVAAKASTVEASANLVEALADFTVYKDPNCGCCVHWITHANDHGYSTETVHPANMSAIKAHYGIAPNLQSCHTAVNQDGYIFEGHVPAKFIKQFLADIPAGYIGLTVPAMVVGSPGMEVGDKFMPYQILALKKDGSSELYQAITSYQQQF
ncbi:DUF411 domain-containing protein [Psychrobium sp. 1_MG-2023]|uniref:DUF411 domain-containing protein n=1 Tax=Psychrobium sp. 1_MG-2023 TaxID=3062624 RepID=UPI000C34B8B7|nr:DUF411 domain-containing protein [Psychrobium sp. 1_MG-2023]MDP2559703.1 DUF411 domain-containing protein [Psychrobium sp. 1_MG-2023]PKF59533.1 metal-binding protein [Alteromonadales bacterium alter-6D02]